MKDKPYFLCALCKRSTPRLDVFVAHFYWLHPEATPEVLNSQRPIKVITGRFEAVE